jgi:hypothetical protein
LETRRDRMGVGVKRVEGVEMRGTRRNPFHLTAMGTTMGKYTECRPTPTGSYRIRDDGKRYVE